MLLPVFVIRPWWQRPADWLTRGTRPKYAAIGEIERFDSPGKLAKADIFEYVEMFYNRTRRHSHLGGVSPEAFEAASNCGL